MKFHGPNEFPQHFAGGIANGEYARMTAEQKAQWDAHYEPENEALLAKLRAGEMSEEEITKWKHQRYMHDYLGCIAAVDDNVGRMLDYLDANGLAENTIVIYGSDQGFYLGEHGWYDKRWMFEESLRMPLLVRWPGVVEAETRAGAMVQNIDYAPTFLEIAGVAVQVEMQGRSILPVLRSGGEKPADWREAIYYAYYENDAVHMVPMHDGVRTERYKAMYFPRTREWNLFDLETDPQEMRSVHADPAYAEILQGLQARYRQLHRQYDVNPAAIAATRGDEAWWKQRDREKRELAKAGDFDLVFLGDSITQGWEGAGKEVWEQHFGSVKALNLGFGGDRTEHLLWRLTRNQMGPSRPRAAVILIGTNNTGHLMQDPDEIAAGVKEIVTTLRRKSPRTKILLLSVFPRGASADDPMRVNNDGVNARIAKLADGEAVVYQDLGDSFLEADGTISTTVMPDRLHLSAEGYRRWAAGILPTLTEWGVIRPAAE
jgi:N-acetylglucosamine-6-sulfatase